MEGTPARCAETNFPAGINLGQWPYPHSRHQCTLLIETLVIIPVVTAMGLGAGQVLVAAGGCGVLNRWRLSPASSQPSSPSWLQLMIIVFFHIMATDEWKSKNVYLSIWRQNLPFFVFVIQ